MAAALQSIDATTSPKPLPKIENENITIDGVIKIIRNKAQSNLQFHSNGFQYSYIK
jgi:hypothetical protein